MIQPKINVHSLMWCPIYFKLYSKTFFSFDGTDFKTEPSSNFPHFYVLSLGSYQNSPFVTGHNSNTNGLKTEILDYEVGEWSSAADYPFSSDR